MTNFEIYTLIIAGCAVIVSAISLPIGYWFGLRSQRVASEDAARQAAANRRKDFLDIATEIKAKLTDRADDMGKWVFNIKEDLLSLKTAYDKIAHEFPGIERVNIKAAMIEIMHFTSMEHGDIYEHGQELLDALNKLPSA